MAPTLPNRIDSVDTTLSFCHDARDERGGDTPIAEPERREDRRDPAPRDHRQDAVFCLVGHHVEREIERLQDPDDDGRHEDDGERALRKSLRLVPRNLPTFLAPGRRWLLAPSRTAPPRPRRAICAAAARPGCPTMPPKYSPTIFAAPLCREERRGEERVDGQLGRRQLTPYGVSRIVILRSRSEAACATPSRSAQCSQRPMSIGTMERPTGRSCAAACP